MTGTSSHRLPPEARSATALRLMAGGFLLLLVESVLLILGPDSVATLRPLLWLVTATAATAQLGALAAGTYEGPSPTEARHGR
jgi:hypothetical protein